MVLEYDPNANDKQLESEKQNDCSDNSTKKETPIVGIGASAGGLAALEAFFSHLPVDNGTEMAFVIVQHLAPNYKSILGNLLQKHTPLKVCEAAEKTTVAPNCIYIIPPDRCLEIRQGKLYLSKRTGSQAAFLPIDKFFRSLAQDQKEKSICIVLSGSGTDGTLGLRAIKGEGGMVMVQDPDSTQHKSMPHSAMATGLVDYVLPPEKMPEQMIAYIQKEFGKQGRLTQTLLASPHVSLQKILNLLHAQTGHNFSGYKQSTVGRRIERRLAVNQIESLDDYFRYLQQSPEEINALFREFLVGVTSFFRDPEAFSALQEKVIPRLFAGKTRGDSIRVWVPGCSTGEEAYSLAILLQEYKDALKEPFTIQLFATDIDKQAIDKARAGIFPPNIASDVSPERLRNYFIREPEGNAYTIKKSIRNMIIFAEQNITEDHPFSKLDLLSCRNLLIYMDGDLQEKMLHLFYYALNPKGFLFLGTSETTGELENLFACIDRKWRIHQSKGLPLLTSTRYFLPVLQPSNQPRYINQKESRSTVRKLMEDILLNQYSPACAVITKSGEILYIHGRTGKYLEPAPGEMSQNIIQMARNGLKLDLIAAIRTAAGQNKPFHQPGLSVQGYGVTFKVNLTVSPLEGHPNHEDLFLVIFEDIAALEEKKQQKEEVAAAGDALTDRRIINLEQELRDKEEHLQTVIEELETSNEELQSTNEELQSTNEELETSKEELQSVNEELMTVNAELQEKLGDLSKTNNDMNNMLAGTGVGTVFVDFSLRIHRYTPPAAELINLIPDDLGRPVNHIASNLIGYDRLGEDVQEVLDTLVPKEQEVQTRKKEWYLMRILPYRTMENSIQGAVITFVNITTHKNMYNALNRLAVVVGDSNDAVTLQNLEGQILAWNPGAEKLYGWSEEEALTMNIRDTVPDDKSDEMLEIVKKLAANKTLETFKTQRLTKRGEIVEVWMTSSVLVDQKGRPYAIATTERRI